MFLTAITYAAIVDWFSFGREFYVDILRRNSASLVGVKFHETKLGERKYNRGLVAMRNELAKYLPCLCAAHNWFKRIVKCEPIRSCSSFLDRVVKFVTESCSRVWEDNRNNSSKEQLCCRVLTLLFEFDLTSPLLSFIFELLSDSTTLLWKNCNFIS